MKKEKFKIVFTKELFIETINEIEKQHNHDRKCSDAFKVLLPNDYTSVYANHWLQNQLLKILQIAMKDNNRDGWIEYWMLELDFGRKWEKNKIINKNKYITLKTAEDLWELLNS